MTWKTEHQQRIEAFMKKAGQELPEEPTIPSEETRILRAKLILEEAIETIEALGITVKLPELIRDMDKDQFKNLEFVADKEPNLVEIADGCIDVSVVTIGTLSACGISDKRLKEIVDNHNLAKFGPGSYRRDDGKWMKPKDLAPPRIEYELKNQTLNGLGIYRNETDTVVALNKQDAIDVLIENCGYCLEEISEFDLLEPDQVLEIYFEDDDTHHKKTVKKWLEILSRGPLASTEY